MLVKNCPEPLEGLDDAAIRSSATPHRINMPSAEEEELLRNGNKRRGVAADDRKDQPDKLIKLPGPRVRKQSNLALARAPIVSPKIITDNHKLTEYFPVRRSVRKCKKAVLEERQRDLENKVLCGVEDGLQVRHFPGKGRGVVTTRDFVKGEYVVEYIGELIDQMTAKKREAKYAKDQNAGCYMYYFQHRNQQYCVDATAESEKLGRLVNHSRNGNLATRIVEIGSIPHLVLIAKEDIPAGVEVSYDYGDRSRESILNHPWLAS
ncbi:histone-lysine N-methyltransferase PR-Set7 [Nasonia vitripennis]|uniref:[histone H4]-lysine(20) N-methyltransferase n=1 Tax=Nasonia vitripennis TaxID=7425 RepID=A0A7M7GGG7_NASVI|nr:histone-lysine N-methyltransferase PR-Set7 [Nasonia vitripennis]